MNIEKLKQARHLYKSAVEEAEEILNDFINGPNFFSTDRALKVLQAIQELKAENERFKR